MSNVLKAVFLSIAIIVAIAIAQPGLTSQLRANPVVEDPEQTLDSVFWIADATDFQSEINIHQMPLAEWLQQINQANVEFLCMGERHTSEFRQFLATTIFPALEIDVLMLEADADEAERIVTAVNAGAKPVNLLGVDIAPILIAVQRRNPDVAIVGVDETRQQTAWKNLEQVRSDRRRLSRDGFIAQNIRAQFTSGKRHVALFGAEHCAAYGLNLGNSRPFFRHLTETLNWGDRAMNINLMSDASTSLLTQGLQQSEDHSRPVVIPTRSLRPETYNYRWDLKSILDPYSILIYF
jgi:hypothetical protein